MLNRSHYTFVYYCPDIARDILILQLVLYNGLGSHIDTIPPKNLTWYLKVGTNYKHNLDIQSG